MEPSRDGPARYNSLKSNHAGREREGEGERLIKSKGERESRTEAEEKTRDRENRGTFRDGEEPSLLRFAFHPLAVPHLIDACALAYLLSCRIGGSSMFRQGL